MVHIGTLMNLMKLFEMIGVIPKGETSEYQENVWKKVHKAWDVANAKLDLCFLDYNLDTELWQIQIVLIENTVGVVFFLLCFQEMLSKRWANLSHYVYWALHGGPACFN